MYEQSSPNHSFSLHYPNFLLTFCSPQPIETITPPNFLFTTTKRNNNTTKTSSVTLSDQVQGMNRNNLLMFRDHVFRLPSGFTKPVAYFIILLLSYYLGYLSAISKNPSYDLHHTPPPKTADIDHFQFQTQCADPIPSQLVRQTILTRLFNGTPPYQNFPEPHIKQFLRPKRIKGWGSTGLVFKNLIHKVKPKIIIEVGTFLGASAIHMAELTSQLGLNTQILCIDDFRGWPELPSQFRDIKMINGDTMLLYQFIQNVVYMNATESIIFLPFSTGSTLEKLCEWGVFADMIEVDAGHDFHSAWSDINRAYKLLRPGGVIFGHDYFTVADNRGVRRAVNMFARVNRLRVKADGQHWVLESS